MGAVQAGLVAAAVAAWPPPAAGAGPWARPPDLAALDPAAEAYVRLVLAAGLHDPALVLAYHGPAAWREEAERDGAPLQELVRRVDELLGRLPGTSEATSPLARWRGAYLRAQLAALRGRLENVGGQPLSFEDQALVFHGVWPPRTTEEEFRRWHAELEPLLPGPGPLAERAAAQRARYRIPAERLPDLLAAGGEACQGSTPDRLLAADPESAVELADADLLPCRQGAAIRRLERLLPELARAQGLPELLVLQAFSPAAFLAEGRARVARQVAFPLEARLELHRRVLFPLAGQDPADAERYLRSRAALDRLRDAARSAAAQRLVDGELDEPAAIAWLEGHALCSRAAAEEDLRLVGAVGAQVVALDLGARLVGRRVEARGGPDPAGRWRALEELSAPPVLPSELAGEAEAAPP